MVKKTDIVILWVDDTDEEWVKKKKYWQEKFGIRNEQKERYRDWNNLQYLFRGIEKFAPWVNHVFLVTDNQQPEWINTEYSKLTIIDHQEIIPKEYLPTFNSQVLELNLHRIPNLSDQFIYFNDDVFLINDTVPEDFFVKGVPRDNASLNLIMPIKRNLISQVVFNNTTLINDYFDKKLTLKKGWKKWLNFNHGIENIRTLLLWIWPNFSSFKQPHLVGVFKKDTFDQVWSLYSEELRSTFTNRFRQFNDYNQWLFRDWQLASNNFIPQKRGFGKDFQLSDKNTVLRCAKAIKNQKHKIICVNDTELLEDFNYSRDIINSSFQEILSNKSEFEV